MKRWVELVLASGRTISIEARMIVAVSELHGNPQASGKPHLAVHYGHGFCEPLYSELYETRAGVLKKIDAASSGPAGRRDGGPDT